jgi:hypothetical protein
MVLVYKVAWYTTYTCLMIRGLPSCIDVIKRAYTLNISLGHLPTSAVQRVRSADEKTWLHLKSSRLWVPTIGSTETARHFGVIYRLHLQCLRVTQAAKLQKEETSWAQLENGGNVFLRNTWRYNPECFAIQEKSWRSCKFFVWKFVILQFIALLPSYKNTF